VPRATLGEPAAFDQIRISPDGQQLAAAVLDPANGGRDLWVYELATSRARRLTLHPPDEQSPVWSPDGRRIAYRSDVNGPPDLYARDASGDGVPDRLLSTRAVSVPEDWMADGLLYQELSRATGFDQWLLPLPGGTPRPLLDTRFSETGGRVSPDGLLVAFESDESGAPQIYVAPVASPGARRAVSTTGGVAPRWRADGRELFFLAPGGAIMAVPMPADTRRPPGTPVALFTLSAAMHGRSYDVTPDGQRFVVNEVVAAIANSPISVILNWAADLRP
jgi:Tol biopolymer transport system component